MKNFAFEVLINGELCGAGWGCYAIHCTSVRSNRCFHASAWLDGYQKNFSYKVSVDDSKLEETGYGKPEIAQKVTFEGNEFEFRIYESPTPPTYPGSSDARIRINL